jgi:hypothetical protein
MDGVGSPFNIAKLRRCDSEFNASVMPDVRHLIAECPRKDAPGAACGVFYADLRERGGQRRPLPKARARECNVIARSPHPLWSPPRLRDFVRTLFMH